MKNTTNDLLHQLQFPTFLLHFHPPRVQQAFQFLLATAVHEGGNPRFGKFGLVRVAEIDRRWHYTFRGAGEVFSVVRAQLSKEMGRQVREEVREILGEEGLL